jgi:DNA polymerase I-like protein with 3'-5' exonuclease and polymerase domains
MFNPVSRILIDARNADLMIPQLLRDLQTVPLCGFDIETEDSQKHAGLRRIKKRLTIDFRRSVICGASFYPDGGNRAYYVNLAHADEQNRLAPATFQKILDECREKIFAIHNAPFELAQFMNSPFNLHRTVSNTICTLQMAVSAYNSDQYDPQALIKTGIGEMRVLLSDIAKEFADFDPAGGMTPEQGALLSKLTGKETSSAYSYNGVVDSIAYGYGLKKAVASFFNYKMATYEETLAAAGVSHMGQLTGDQVLAYGADDAIWCMRLYHRLLQYMIETNPKVVETFFRQEMPMVFVYAQAKVDGLRIDPQAVQVQRERERENCAALLRRLKASIRNCMPFPTQLNEYMEKHEKWYTKNGKKYRDRIIEFANKLDADDAFSQVSQISGAVSSAWSLEQAEEEFGEGAKVSKSKELNLTHYMPMRTILYDLIGTKPIVEKGKLQSDNDARLRVQLRLEKRQKEGDTSPKLQAQLDLISCINELSGLEQRMKLYLNPYMNLIDPETGRVYPTLSSMLNTRRIAGSDPNSMQLAKRGTSTYVRGFYEADNPDDELMVSLDWSQIELVLIGEFSGDPEFAKAYGQKPYNDLHIGATASALAVMNPQVTEDNFRALKTMSLEEALDIFGRPLLRTTNGEDLTPAKAYSYWRTEVGKGSNFNYWYSGALSTVGQRLGWTSEQMWEATERYRQRFAVAEQWRVEEIAKIRTDGYVTLPDHHTRVRVEATQFWRDLMLAHFDRYAAAAGAQGIMNFARLFVKKVANRAGNQAINAKIQGSCATLLKRSIPKINTELKGSGLRARFKMPVHDEIVFSSHWKDVVPTIKVAKACMTNHPEIISKLVIDCSASVGRTFEPYSPKVPYGQIEIDEAPALPFIPNHLVGKSLPDDLIEEVCKYLIERK